MPSSEVPPSALSADQWARRVDHMAALHQPQWASWLQKQNNEMYKGATTSATANNTAGASHPPTTDAAGAAAIIASGDHNHPHSVHRGVGVLSGTLASTSATNAASRNTASATTSFLHNSSTVSAASVSAVVSGNLNSSGVTATSGGGLKRPASAAATRGGAVGVGGSSRPASAAAARGGSSTASTPYYARSLAEANRNRQQQQQGATTPPPPPSSSAPLAAAETQQSAASLLTLRHEAPRVASSGTRSRPSSATVSVHEGQLPRHVGTSTIASTARNFGGGGGGAAALDVSRGVSTSRGGGEHHADASVDNHNHRHRHFQTSAEQMLRASPQHQRQLGGDISQIYLARPPSDEEGIIVDIYEDADGERDASTVVGGRGYVDRHGNDANGDGGNGNGDTSAAFDGAMERKDGDAEGSTVRNLFTAPSSSAGTTKLSRMVPLYQSEHGADATTVTTMHAPATDGTATAGAAAARSFDAIPPPHQNYRASTNSNQNDTTNGVRPLRFPATTYSSDLSSSSSSVEAMGEALVRTARSFGLLSTRVGDEDSHSRAVMLDRKGGAGDGGGTQRNERGIYRKEDGYGLSNNTYASAMLAAAAAAVRREHSNHTNHSNGSGGTNGGGGGDANGGDNSGGDSLLAPPPAVKLITVEDDAATDASTSYALSAVALLEAAAVAMGDHPTFGPLFQCLYTAISRGMLSAALPLTHHAAASGGQSTGKHTASSASAGGAVDMLSRLANTSVIAGGSSTPSSAAMMRDPSSVVQSWVLRRRDAYVKQTRPFASIAKGALLSDEDRVRETAQALINLRRTKRSLKQHFRSWHRHACELRRARERADRLFQLNFRRQYLSKSFDGWRRATAEGRYNKLFSDQTEVRFSLHVESKTKNELAVELQHATLKIDALETERRQLVSELSEARATLADLSSPMVFDFRRPITDQFGTPVTAGCLYFSLGGPRYNYSPSSYNFNQANGSANHHHSASSGGGSLSPSSSATRFYINGGGEELWLADLGAMVPPDGVTLPGRELQQSHYVIRMMPSSTPTSLAAVGVGGGGSSLDPFVSWANNHTHSYCHAASITTASNGGGPSAAAQQQQQQQHSNGGGAGAPLINVREPDVVKIHKQFITAKIANHQRRAAAAEAFRLNKRVRNVCLVEHEVTPSYYIRHSGDILLTGTAPHPMATTTSDDNATSGDPHHQSSSSTSSLFSSTAQNTSNSSSQQQLQQQQQHNSLNVRLSQYAALLPSYAREGFYRAVAAGPPQMPSVVNGVVAGTTHNIITASYGSTHNIITASSSAGGGGNHGGGVSASNNLSSRKSLLVDSGKFGASSSSSAATGRRGGAAAAATFFSSSSPPQPPIIDFNTHFLCYSLYRALCRVGVMQSVSYADFIGLTERDDDDDGDGGNGDKEGAADQSKTTNSGSKGGVASVGGVLGAMGLSSSAAGNGAQQQQQQMPRNVLSIPPPPLPPVPSSSSSSPPIATEVHDLVLSRLMSLSMMGKAVDGLAKHRLRRAQLRERREVERQRARQQQQMEEEEEEGGGGGAVATAPVSALPPPLPLSAMNGLGPHGTARYRTEHTLQSVTDQRCINNTTMTVAATSGGGSGSSGGAAVPSPLPPLPSSLPPSSLATVTGLNAYNVVDESNMYLLAWVRHVLMASVGGATSPSSASSSSARIVLKRSGRGDRGADAGADVNTSVFTDDSSQRDSVVCTPAEGTLYPPPPAASNPLRPPAEGEGGRGSGGGGSAATTSDNNVPPSSASRQCNNKGARSAYSYLSPEHVLLMTNFEEDFGDGLELIATLVQSMRPLDSRGSLVDVVSSIARGGGGGGAGDDGGEEEGCSAAMYNYDFSSPFTSAANTTNSSKVFTTPSALAAMASVSNNSYGLAATVDGRQNNSNTNNNSASASHMSATLGSAPSLQEVPTLIAANLLCDVAADELHCHVPPMVRQMLHLCTAESRRLFVMCLYNRASVVADALEKSVFGSFGAATHSVSPQTHHHQQQQMSIACPLATSAYVGFSFAHSTSVLFPSSPSFTTNNIPHEQPLLIAAPSATPEFYQQQQLNNASAAASFRGNTAGSRPSTSTLVGAGSTMMGGGRGGGGRLGSGSFSGGAMGLTAPSAAAVDPPPPPSTVATTSNSTTGNTNSNPMQLMVAMFGNAVNLSGVPPVLRNTFARLLLLSGSSVLGGGANGAGGSSGGGGGGGTGRRREGGGASAQQQVNLTALLPNVFGRKSAAVLALKGLEGVTAASGTASAPLPRASSPTAGGGSAAGAGGSAFSSSSTSQQQSSSSTSLKGFFLPMQFENSRLHGFLSDASQVGLYRTTLMEPLASTYFSVFAGIACAVMPPMANPDVFKAPSMVPFNAIAADQPAGLLWDAQCLLTLDRALFPQYYTYQQSGVPAPSSCLSSLSSSSSSSFSSRSVALPSPLQLLREVQVLRALRDCTARGPAALSPKDAQRLSLKVLEAYREHVMSGGGAAAIIGALQKQRQDDESANHNHTHSSFYNLNTHRPSSATSNHNGGGGGLRRNDSNMTTVSGINGGVGGGGILSSKSVAAFGSILGAGAGTVAGMGGKTRSFRRTNSSGNVSREAVGFSPSSQVQVGGNVRKGGGGGGGIPLTRAAMRMNRAVAEGKTQQQLQSGGHVGSSPSFVFGDAATYENEVMNDDDCGEDGGDCDYDDTASTSTATARRGGGGGGGAKSSSSSTPPPPPATVLLLLHQSLLESTAKLRVGFHQWPELWVRYVLYTTGVMGCLPILHTYDEAQSFYAVNNALTATSVTVEGVVAGRTTAMMAGGAHSTTAAASFAAGNGVGVSASAVFEGFSATTVVAADGGGGGGVASSSSGSLVSSQPANNVPAVNTVSSSASCIGFVPCPAASSGSSPLLLNRRATLRPSSPPLQRQLHSSHLNVNANEQQQSHNHNHNHQTSSAGDGGDVTGSSAAPLSPSSVVSPSSHSLTLTPQLLDEWRRSNYGLVSEVTRGILLRRVANSIASGDRGLWVPFVAQSFASTVIGKQLLEEVLVSGGKGGGGGVPLVDGTASSSGPFSSSPTGASLYPPPLPPSLPLMDAAMAWDDYFATTVPTSGVPVKAMLSCVVSASPSASSPAGAAGGAAAAAPSSYHQHHHHQLIASAGSTAPCSPLYSPTFGGGNSSSGSGGNVGVSIEVVPPPLSPFAAPPSLSATTTTAPPATMLGGDGLNSGTSPPTTTTAVVTAVIPTYTAVAVSSVDALVKSSDASAVFAQYSSWYGDKWSQIGNRVMTLQTFAQFCIEMRLCHERSIGEIMLAGGGGISPSVTPKFGGSSSPSAPPPRISSAGRNRSVSHAGRRLTVALSSSAMGVGGGGIAAADLLSLTPSVGLLQRQQQRSATPSAVTAALLRAGATLNGSSSAAGLCPSSSSVPSPLSLLHPNSSNTQITPLPFKVLLQTFFVVAACQQCSAAQPWLVGLMASRGMLGGVTSSLNSIGGGGGGTSGSGKKGSSNKKSGGGAASSKRRESSSLRAEDRSPSPLGGGTFGEGGGGGGAGGLASPPISISLSASPNINGMMMSSERANSVGDGGLLFSSPTAVSGRPNSANGHPSSSTARRVVRRLDGIGGEVVVRLTTTAAFSEHRTALMVEHALADYKESCCGERLGVGAGGGGPSSLGDADAAAPASPQKKVNGDSTSAQNINAANNNITPNPRHKHARSHSDEALSTLRHHGFRQLLVFLANVLVPVPWVPLPAKLELLMSHTRRQYAAVLLEAASK